jgi:hypothetical protein
MFGLGRTLAMAMTVPTAGVLSPWVDQSFLERVVVPDMWPADVPRPMTRGEAMMVPAVSRSRHLICATTARLPLQAVRGDTPLPDPDQPYWCYGTDGQLGALTTEQRVRYALPVGQSPFVRMLGTCDDLLFTGWALWLVTATYADGRPRSAVHVAAGGWDVAPDGVLVDADGHPFTVGPDDAPAPVILIQGPHEGVLTFGARSIRGAGSLETTAADVARTPFRIGLHQTTDITLTETEQAQMVAETKRALADNQGVLFTNSAVEVTEYRLDSSELLVSGRQAAALDVARHMNLPGALIDAEPQGGSTLSYSNPTSRNQQWLDYGLQSFLDAVAARLSMDDVVPAGQRVAFDTSSLTSTLAPPLGAPTQD